MSQLSSVIKFLAACRMKEDQKGVKSCAGELGGKNQIVALASYVQFTFVAGGGTCRVVDGALWSGQIVT